MAKRDYAKEYKDYHGKPHTNIDVVKIVVSSYAVVCGCVGGENCTHCHFCGEEYHKGNCR